jgi:hypothetical protein
MGAWRIHSTILSRRAPRGPTTIRSSTQ